MAAERFEERLRQRTHRPAAADELEMWAGEYLTVTNGEAWAWADLVAAVREVHGRYHFGEDNFGEDNFADLWPALEAMFTKLAALDEASGRG